MIETVKVRLPIHFDTSWLIENPDHAEQFAAMAKPEHVAIVTMQLRKLADQLLLTAVALGHYEQETPSKLAFRTGRPVDEFLVGKSRRRELERERGYGE